MELSIHPYISDILNGTSDAYLQCLLLFVFSMFPITECRLTIPFGILVFGLPWYLVFLICVISNALVGVFLIFALDKLIYTFRKFRFFKFIIDRFIISSKRRYQKDGIYRKVKRYIPYRFRTSGLLLFVGLPLPGTGAWTGALVSYVIGLHKGLAMISIVQGVILSGIIMTILSLTGIAIIL